MQKIKTAKIIAFSIITAIIYILLTIYATNISLINDTLFGQYPLTYKLNILWLLGMSFPTTISLLNFLLLITIALLTGFSLSLIVKRIIVIRKFGGIEGVTLSSSSIGIISSGCAACGLPILGLLGLSGSLVYLPLHGTEFSLISVILLSISCYFLIKNNQAYDKCAINSKKSKKKL